MSECEHYILSKYKSKIELWLKEKLPYPNKVKDLPPWVENALCPLRNELEALNAEQKEIIEAEYISTHLRGDVENVLFYNIRSNTSFKKSSRHGLRFRYLDRKPRKPPKSAKFFPHYQSYQLVKSDTPFLLDECENIARYKFDVTHIQIPDDVWWHSVNAGWKLKVRVIKQLQEDWKFALRIHAWYPQSPTETRQYAVRHMKKLFDGISSAMHVWTNEEWVNKVAGRVAKAWKVSPNLVRAKLQNNAYALLGPNDKRRWDPDDDRLVAGELLLFPNTKDNWHFEVEILAIV